MIVCMPTVGAKVRVMDGQQWSFKLFSEYRNYGAMKYFGGQPPDYRCSCFDDFEGGEAAVRARRNSNGTGPVRKHLPVILEGGSILTIDRIYLRKGKGDFDSITFILNGAKIPDKKGAQARVRFWVRLDDVNAGNLELLQ